MPDTQTLWNLAIEAVRGRAHGSFDQWFSSVQYEGIEAGILRLAVRDEFVRDWVRTHFVPALLSEL